MKKLNSSNMMIVLFFSLYMILPSYFALEINESLPLMTASRIILLFCFIIVVLKGYGKLPISMIKELGNDVKLYFLLFIIIDIYHMFDTGVSSFNHLFILLFEQFGVIWIIMILINNKFKFKKSIHILMYSSAIVAIISIIGFVFNSNPFYILNTVSRSMTQAGTTDIGYRNGLLRIEAGFGHPVYYGMYCSIMIFLSFYVYNYERKKVNSFLCLLLNIVSLVLTNSRGSILGVIVTIFISLIINGAKERKKYYKFFIIFILFFSLSFILSLRVRGYIINILQSFLVYFGITQNTSVNFGANMSFTSDRLMQFTGIIWTLMMSPIFGFGYGAQSKSVISYYNIGKWFPTTTFDVGYVEIFCCYGIVGSIAFLFLIRCIIKKLKFIKRESYSIMFRNMFIVYFICLLSVVNIDRIFWVILGLLLAYSRIVKLESRIEYESIETKMD